MVLNLMKKIVVCSFLLLLLQIESSGASIDSIVLARTTEIVNMVTRQFAPDKRTVLFKTTIQSTSPLILDVETTDDRAVQELKSLLARENLNAIINEQLLPSKDMGDKIYGIVNLSVCNDRSTGNHPAEMVSQSLLGTPVEILKKEKGFYLIRTPDHYISWTDNLAIQSMTKDEFTQWQSANKVVYTHEYGHSYQKPSTKLLPVSDLVEGNVLEVIGKEKKFFKVIYPDKRIAYILKKEVILYNKWISRADPKAGAIINTAKTLIGVPYLWGGTSIKGVDCSGFTKTCYFLNGIILPRDASQQALIGKKIDIYENDKVSIAKCLKNLKPGDLLFFAGKIKEDSASKKVTHTALYIGEGVFIQSSGLVRISSLVAGATNYDEFATKSLIGARNILTQIGSEDIIRIDHHPLYKADLK
jgi:hypothetical protein